MGCTTSKTAVTPSEAQRQPKQHPKQEGSLQEPGWRRADQSATVDSRDVSGQHVAATDAEIARGHSPSSHARTGTHESGTDIQHAYSASAGGHTGQSAKTSQKSGGTAVTAGSSTEFTSESQSGAGTSRSAEPAQQSEKVPSSGTGHYSPVAGEMSRETATETESRQASDLGATSDSESVHEFDEELDATNKIEVIRDNPTVRVNAAHAGYSHDDARSTTTAEYGIASEEDSSSGGHQSRQHSDGGRDMSAARAAQHSALSAHSGAADGPGSLHVERHLEVPGGAPQSSPYKQQNKAFGKLTDQHTAVTGMHSIQEDGSAGGAASGPQLPPPRAPTESRVLRNVQSFRAVTGKAIPRARRDGVIPTESFELHAYHAAQEGAGGPTSPAKFRPKMGAIKSEEEVDFILATLGETFLFSHLTDSERRRVAHAFEQSSYVDGERIMEQGRLGKTFYILASGSADMQVDGKSQGSVRQGGAFGELALLYDEPRAASIVAKGECTAWGLNRDAFRAIVVTSAAKTHQQYIGFLRGVPLLKTLREQQLAALADALTPVNFEDGECIVRQGEEGKVFFIVAEGSVRLTKKVDGAADTPGSVTGVKVDDEEVEFLVLEPGAHFGEQSLIHESRRQASAYAMGDVSCLALLREDFVTMMGTLKDAMEKAHTERVVKERVATLRATRSFIGSFASIQKANSKASGSRRYSGGQGMLDLGAAKPQGKRHPILDDMGHEAKASEVHAAAPAALAPADVRGPVSGQGAAAVASGSGSNSGIHRPKRASMDTITGFRGQIGAPPKPVRKSKGPVGLKLDLSESHTLAADVQPVVPPQPSSGNKVSTAFASSQFPAGPAGAVTAPHSSDTGDVGFGTVKRDQLQSMSEPPAIKSALLREPPSLAGASRAAAGESVAGMRAAIHSFRRVRTDMTLDSLQFLAVLGEGAFGQVTLVKHPGTEQVYAMKQMQKARIVKLKQQRNVLNEKSVLMRVREHPYILNLVKTFNTPDSLYLVLEFLQGGDLFGLMTRLGGRLQPRVAMYYAATVTSVLGFLHRRNIVYRDLKPENLVLDSSGYLRVVDFGFAKVVADKTYTLCGTPEYIAPEMVTGKGHGKGVDYWALGVLTYEMLAGYSPFADHAGRDHRTIYKKILRGTFRWSSKISDPALRDLIAQLLTSNPSKRLGCLRGGEDDIRAHSWFQQGNFDWAALDSKQLPPPVVPDVRGPADVSHFEDFKETSRATIVPYKDDGSGWDAGF